MDFAEVQPDVGILLPEARQARQQEIARLGTVDVNTNQPRRLGADEGALRILHVRDQAHAALVIGLAIQGRTDLPGRALQ